MELALKDASGAVEVSEATFGREFNEALVHQVVVAYAAGARDPRFAQGRGHRAGRYRSPARFPFPGLRRAAWCSTAT